MFTAYADNKFQRVILAPWHAQVYKALRRGTTMVAVKKMDCDADEETLHQIMKESAILQRVANDPNVVQFYGTCLCNPPLICMEFMEVRRVPAVQ